MSNNNEQRRSYYRIQYNASNCPRFKFSGGNFEILDLSEQGFRFVLKSSAGLRPEMDVSGSMTFPDGESFLIHGTVKRVSGTEISVQLKKNLPLRKIMAEQQRLIAMSAATGT